jgi:AraC family transcriptional regulator
VSGARAWNRSYGSQAEFYEHAYGQHITTLRPAGSLGATLIEASQSAGDWSDAPTPDLSVGWLPSLPVSFSVDLGAGRFAGVQRTNDAILIAPGAGSRILMEGAHVCRLLTFRYQTLLSFCTDRGAALPLDGDFGPLHARLLGEPSLAQLLNTLWDETQTGAAHGSMLADGLLLQIIGTLLRMRDPASAPAPPVARGGLAPWQVKRVSDYIQSDLAADPGLAELASIVGLSTEHFCRAFKASTGLPPHAWLVSRRIERARELLERTNLPVEEIAAQVGYAEPSHLARMFRRAHGVSPTQYRRERRL